MKNNYYINIFIIFLITISIILPGCKSIPNTKEENENTKKVSPVKENQKDEKIVEKIETEKTQKSQETKIIIKEAPDWYNYPPSSDEIFFTLGSAKSKNMQFALEKATDWAKQELSIKIERKVYNVSKDFIENYNPDKSILYFQFLEQFSRKISLNAISNMKIKERDVKAIGNDFVAFSLIELSLVNLSKTIDESARYYDNEYAELKINLSIKELSNELKKLKSSDFTQY